MVGLKRKQVELPAPTYEPGTGAPDYDMGLERAHDQARQRGIADAVYDLIETGAFNKFNVGPDRVIQLVCYLYNLDPILFQRT